MNNQRHEPAVVRGLGAFVIDTLKRSGAQGRVGGITLSAQRNARR